MCVKRMSASKICRRLYNTKCAERKASIKHCERCGRGLLQRFSDNSTQSSSQASTGLITTNISRDDSCHTLQVVSGHFDLFSVFIEGGRWGSTPLFLFLPFLRFYNYNFCFSAMLASSSCLYVCSWLCK